MTSEPLTTNGWATGLVGTLAYRIIDAAGTVRVARTTTGISEIGGGSYKVTASIDTAWGGLIVVWDDGTYFATDTINSSSSSSGGSSITAADIWAYAQRTLTAGTIQVISPWQVGTLTIAKGSSYLNADSTAISISKAASATWPSNLLSAGDYIITFTCTPTSTTLRDVPAAVGFTNTGAVVSATQIRIGDISAAVSGTLSIPRHNGTNAYTYEVTASRSSGTIVHLLERGNLSVG